MRCFVALAAVAAALFPLFALAPVGYGEPPAGYYAAPLADWAHQNVWRHIRCRCERRDRDACYWTHDRAG
ncbi:MAG TPA: hypothetical protein VFA03_00490 [Acetobacteraceae bacterium]|nr:hypothetical protein [Acetobacteraceae bacterium]